MKKYSLLLSTVVLATVSCRQNVEFVVSTFDQPWVKTELADEIHTDNVVVVTDKSAQRIEGFGTCFNELGWTALGELPVSDRRQIMKELFADGSGANFTICRMPVGANDFSRDWYSYDETDGDFELNDFSIDNDRETLIPFIKEALRYNKNLKIWASPWSPPTWMKVNRHYAMRATSPSTPEKYSNGLEKENQGREGTDMFRCEEEYFDTYARYFGKFIDAYREEGIELFAVMPQNEFNSDQVFPSCCWTATSLAKFVGEYLGKEMEQRGVKVLFGTMERANESLVDTVLCNPEASKYVVGVGFQWAGKNALPGIHKRYPNMLLVQSEQECGNGKNDWAGAEYAWNLMRYYLTNGVSIYEYWNTALLEGGISRWGWAQNSLLTINAKDKTYKFTPEYYVMKHVSHYVKGGAQRLETSGYENVLAFANPNGGVVVVVGNDSDEENSIAVNIYGKDYRLDMQPHSIGTLLVE